MIHFTNKGEQFNFCDIMFTYLTPDLGYFLFLVKVVVVVVNEEGGGESSSPSVGTGVPN